MSRGRFAATLSHAARTGAVVVVALLASAGAALAAPTWLPAFEPLADSSGFVEPVMNARGEILFADRADLGGGRKAFRVTSRSTDGSIGAPVVLPPAGATTLPSVPSLGLADDGHAIVAWNEGAAAFYALRSPGGTWGAPTTVPGAANVSNVVAAIDANGTATLAWGENTRTAPDPANLNSLAVKIVRIGPAGSVSSTQTLVQPPASLGTVSVGSLRVAGTGAAVLVYDVQGSVLFATPTVAFRDGATGRFGGAIDLAPDFFPRVMTAVSDSGRVAVVQPAPGAGTVIPLRVREAGGGLGGASDIDAGGSPANVAVGLAGDGAITLAWDIQSPPDPRVLACTATASDCIGEPQRISPPTDALNLSSLAVNPAGTALVAWKATQFRPAVTNTAKAALRPASSAAFGPAQDVAPAPSQSAVVALDAAGDGVAVFNVGTGPSGPYKATGLAAAGPQISAFGAPTSATQGVSTAFAASASDLWSPFELSWSFGDGATASGGSVSHAFAAAGAFPVTVTATDAVGNSTSRSATVTVSGNAGPPGAADTASPRVERLRIASRRFRVGAGPTAISAARRGAGGRRHGGAPSGTTFGYSLSEAATATFQIDRVKAGRRVARRCRKPTRVNRRHRACKRYVPAGTLTRHAEQGANTLAFSGRIGRRALAPGAYRLTLTARDAAGNVSKPSSLTFTIVRR